MSGNSSGGRVAFDIGGFVLKITETGTEPSFFYHQRTGTEMKFLELHSSNLQTCYNLLKQVVTSLLE